MRRFQKVGGSLEHVLHVVFANLNIITHKIQAAYGAGIIV